MVSGKIEEEGKKENLESKSLLWLRGKQQRESNSSTPTVLQMTQAQGFSTRPLAMARKQIKSTRRQSSLASAKAWPSKRFGKVRLQERSDARRLERRSIIIPLTTDP